LTGLEICLTFIESFSPWTDVGVALESEITFSDQECGKQREHRILAVNRVGDGEASNFVTAVL
jgi:hypothetical protein